jgi:hypothetical protein
MGDFKHVCPGKFQRVALLKQEPLFWSDGGSEHVGERASVVLPVRDLKVQARWAGKKPLIVRPSDKRHGHVFEGRMRCDLFSCGVKDTAERRGDEHELLELRGGMQQTLTRSWSRKPEVS